MDTTSRPSSSPIAAPPKARQVGRAFSSSYVETGTVGPRSSGNAASSNGVEILFSHDAGRVVAFSPPINAVQTPTRTRGEQPQEEQPSGSLPWTSPTERLISYGKRFSEISKYEEANISGRLKLYRAHSVAFLSAGEVVHAILAKSQCWCVDGETKFVLRIRGNAYYRIELPNFGESDKQNAEVLKDVFAKVLMYEKTPCPFTRGFTVELPEPPQVPVRKKRWKPSERETPSPSIEYSEQDLRLAYPESKSHRVGTPDAEVQSNEGLGIMDSPSRRPRMGLTSNDVLRTPPSRALVASRSITSPAQLYMTAASFATPSHSAQPSPQPSEQRKPSSSSSLASMNESSMTSSINSFHSVKSEASDAQEEPPPKWKSPFPSSAEQLENEESAKPLDEVGVANLTITPSTPRRWKVEEPNPESEDGGRAETPQPATPGLISDEEEPHDERSEIATPSTRPRQWRAEDNSSVSHTHTLNEITPTENCNAPPPLSSHHHHNQSIFSASSQPSSPSSTKSTATVTAAAAVYPLTTIIVKKTCTFVLGTSTQLINTMLSIARKIMDGMLRGVIIGISEGGERIPCSWDFSDTEDEAEVNRGFVEEEEADMFADDEGDNNGDKVQGLQRDEVEPYNDEEQDVKSASTFPITNQDKEPRAKEEEEREEEEAEEPSHDNLPSQSAAIEHIPRRRRPRPRRKSTCSSSPSLSSSSSSSSTEVD